MEACETLKKYVGELTSGGHRSRLSCFGIAIGWTVLRTCHSSKHAGLDFRTGSRGSSAGIRAFYARNLEVTSNPDPTRGRGAEVTLGSLALFS